jgi:hypothetical protein
MSSLIAQPHQALAYALVLSGIAATMPRKANRKPAGALNA